MKNKFKYLLFVLITFMVCTLKVDAASTCSSTQLYDEKVAVSEMNVDYEIIEEQMYEENGDPEYWYEYYLYINIYNVPDNVTIYVESQNETFNPFSVSSNQRDDKGTIIIRDKDNTKLKRFKFSVKSTSKDCNGEVLKTMTLNTPMANELANAPACAGSPDFKYCAKFTDFDVSQITASDFNKALQQYKDELNKEEQGSVNNSVEKVKEVISKYWVVLVILVIIIGGLITYVVIKKKRSRII